LTNPIRPDRFRELIRVLGIPEKQTDASNNVPLITEHPSVTNIPFSVAGNSNVSKWQLLKMNPALPTTQFTLLLTITLSKIVIDSLPPNNPENPSKPMCEDLPMHRFDRIVRQRTELLPMFSNNKPFVPRFDSIMQYSMLR
jgi:hypothetical protein